MVPATTRPSAAQTVLVLAAFAAEFLLFFYGRNAFGPYVSPVLYVGASLLFTAAAWRALRNQPYILGAASAMRPRWAYPVAMGLLAVALYPRLREIIEQYPVDVKMSDVLPSIEIYLRRFQTGQPVYALITEFGYDLSPTYLPMMWLPYLLPDALNVDYRWLGLWVLAVGALLYAYRLASTAPSLYGGILKLLLPLVLFWPLLGHDTHILGLSIETMIIGYYFILVAGILSQSTAFRAVGLLLCLLSRFSLLFWIPFYLWLIYRHEGPKRAFWLVALVAIGVLGIYVIPFLSADWSAFMKGQGAYTAAAVAEWQNNVGPDGLPTQLFRGVGLASLFYKYAPGDFAARINLLRGVHLVATVGSVAAVAAWYWLRRHRLTLDYRHLALLALKLNLTFFYAFIQVPYDNLLLLVPFMSVWIILCLKEPEASPAQS
ncbi:hypothetical protein [Hymenobacter sediminicola]|uniref:DUF2029 domain-containing protein n=1 Tax=Hymenobacter sediminicola TaxID=2761579 RepID=A0A7G7W6X7_9BACT|nr:hypothetical protein [Hymenobacter sediminicola]QNH62120.1 hypothetical protein H4317_18550 [Hymenobacter sediminicola]